jgi:hypothetical protein
MSGKSKELASVFPQYLAATAGKIFVVPRRILYTTVL